MLVRPSAAQYAAMATGSLSCPYCVATFPVNGFPSPRLRKKTSSAHSYGFSPKTALASLDVMRVRRFSNHAGERCSRTGTARMRASFAEGACAVIFFPAFKKNGRVLKKNKKKWRSGSWTW